VKNDEERWMKKGMRIIDAICVFDTVFVIQDLKKTFYCFLTESESDFDNIIA